MAAFTFQYSGLQFRANRKNNLKQTKGNNQNYWVFGFCPSSGIIQTREPNVSETGSVSVLRWGRETPTLLGPLERAIFNSLEVVSSS
jgi:hypothetical protein